MSQPTRGFLSRRHQGRDPRLPAGQYDVRQDFPVLTAEVTPELGPAAWTMSVDGRVSSAQTWTWQDLHRLPGSGVPGRHPLRHDLVPRLGTAFGGVSADLLLNAAGPLPEATHVLATSATGCTTNLPLEHVGSQLAGAGV